jgi:hypothetical protein
MADFTDQDKELLDKLRKQFDRTGKTTSLRDPWQERMVHDTSAPSRSVLAAKVLEGFSGSWASQYNYGYGSVAAPDVEAPSTAEEFIAPDDQGAPVPIRAKTSKIGLRGPPEINFQPFDCYTNKFGTKGPSLVGHPISFEIVGSTLKSDFCDWTWIVQEGAGLDGGDRLIMSSRPDGGAAVSSQVNQAYNVTPFSGVGTVGEPNGGLYIVIADDGVNPGSIYQPGAEVPMGALPDYLDTAKYEIFRVHQISEGILDLHPSKRLSTFFDLPLASVDRRIRAITMLKPYVTRLQAHPGTGAGLGREQTFSVLIPEFSASSDLYPPYNGGGIGTWLTGGFTSLTAPDDPGATGSTYPGVYGGKMRLPIPQPVKDGWAFVQRQATFAFLPTDIGEWQLKSTPTGNAQFLGLRTDQILRISHTKRSQDYDFGLGSVPSCIGWFPITSLPPTEPPSINLARNAEVDPQSGLIFWGPGPLVVAAFTTPEVEVDFTVHDPVSLIWGDGVLPTLPFNIDKVEAATLRNLIDPNWVGRFEKQVSQAFPSPLTSAYPLSPPAGSGGGRPNRAIFNTANFKGSIEDPGSLLDLGFRMVLFPAKDDDAGVAVPDFDNPIYSHEVVIDGSIDEKQYIEIDYSAGLVRLSHPPPPLGRAGLPTEPTEIIPNGLPGETTNNQRREVILFAACVPYSMEDSQAGTGNRITASAGEGAPDEDVYSKQVEAKLELSEMTFVGSPPWIGPSTYGTVDIVLDRLWDGPATGVVTITTGGDTSRPLGRWGYTETRVETAGTAPDTYPVTVLSGISSFPAAVTPAPLAAGQTRGVILRREVFFGQESANLGSITDFYPTDKVYGSSVRAETLRFQQAKLKPQLDGSLSVQPMPDLGAVLDRPLSTLVPSKYTRPYNLIDNTGPFTSLSSYFSETGLWQGMVYQAEPSDPRGGNPGGVFNLLRSVASPALEFRPNSPVTPSWHGAMAPYFGALSSGMIRIGDNWRWVAKVSLVVRNPLPDPEPKFFLGFVQDEAGGLQATVGGGGGTGITDLATLLPSFTGVGFYLDGSSQSSWNFWNRGFGGPDNFVQTQAGITGGVGAEGPWYMVIESNRLNVGNTTSAQVKFGIYDADKNLLSSNTVTNVAQLPVSFGGIGLNFGFGVRKEIGIGPGDNLFIHHMALSANIDQDDLPPLP